MPKSIINRWECPRPFDFQGPIWRWCMAPPILEDLSSSFAQKGARKQLYIK